MVLTPLQLLELITLSGLVIGFCALLALLLRRPEPAAVSSPAQPVVTQPVAAPAPPEVIVKVVRVPMPTTAPTVIYGPAAPPITVTTQMGSGCGGCQCGHRRKRRRPDTPAPIVPPAAPQETKPAPATDKSGHHCPTAPEEGGPWLELGEPVPDPAKTVVVPEGTIMCHPGMDLPAIPPEIPADDGDGKSAPAPAPPGDKPKDAPDKIIVVTT